MAQRLPFRGPTKPATEGDCDAVLSSTSSNLLFTQRWHCTRATVPRKAPLPPPPPPLPCTMRQGSACLSSTVFLIHSSFRKMLYKLWPPTVTFSNSLAPPHRVRARYNRGHWGHLLSCFWKSVGFNVEIRRHKHSSWWLINVLIERRGKDLDPWPQHFWNPVWHMKIGHWQRTNYSLYYHKERVSIAVGSCFMLSVEIFGSFTWVKVAVP